MLNIRPAQISDSDHISELIQLLAPAFFVSTNGLGAEDFIVEIQPEALSLLICRSDIEYYCAENSSGLCGVVSIRDKTHLHHLFVKPECQGHGIGRRLWAFANEKMLENADQNLTLTVNSSLNAIPVYERFGFKKIGHVTEKNGLIFQSMLLLIEYEQ